MGEPQHWRTTTKGKTNTTWQPLCSYKHSTSSRRVTVTVSYSVSLPCPPNLSCAANRTVNNLAISLAQQSAPAAAAAATTPAISAPANRQELVKNATSWAEKALDVAARIGLPERDEECDMGCAIATHNLGEFAEMNGNVAEARKRYQEAISLGKAIGFDEGVKNSQEGLKRLAKKKSG